MIYDRLGVLTDEVSSGLEEALDWAAEHSLKHVEIRMVDGVNVMDLSDEQVLKVRQMAEARGLYVSVLASPIFKCALDPARNVLTGDRFGQEEESVASHFAMLERSFAIARLLGTNRIRIFSFWREEMPCRHEADIVAHLRKAAELAEKEGVVLLLENEPACNGGFADEVARYVSLVDRSSMKVLWDPGNEEYGGRSAYPEGYEAVRDVLAHVHLKDVVLGPDGVPRCVPMGEGRVRYREQLEALEEDGYTGLFTIETHYIPAGGAPMQGTALTLDGLRAVTKEVNSA